MEILTRREAIQRKLGEYFTGLPCRNGHTAKRYTQSSACYECIHPKIPAPGKLEREARRLARSRMTVRKFRVADSQLETFKAQALGLALSYEPTVEMRDLETRGRVFRLCKWASIYPLRIFPEMEAYLRPLELQSWGDEPNGERPLPLPADYWPSGDPT